MPGIGQDIRYALRRAIRRPLHSLIIVLVLSLGIGAGSGLLSLADTIFWRPLPFPHSDQMVALYRHHPQLQRYGTFSAPDYRELSRRSTAVDGLLAFAPVPIVLSGEERARWTEGEIVSGNYFNLLGLQAQKGRLLLPSDDQEPGAHRVAVISNRLWKGHFGGAADIVGRHLEVNRQSYQIAGVAPPGFQGVRFDTPREIWVPLSQQSDVIPGVDLLGRRELPWLVLAGRLAPNVSMEEAQARLSVLDGQLRRQGRPEERQWTMQVWPGRYVRFWPSQRGQLAHFFQVLLAIAGGILLVGCTSAGGLLLHRMRDSRQEFALRQALGASRARISRQVIIEILLFSVLGGLGGLLAARLTLALVAAFPLPAAVHTSAPVDWRMAGFALLATVLTALAFGVAPLWASRRDALQHLKWASRPGAPGLRRSLGRGLVVAQIALTLMTVSAAVLMGESLRKARTTDLGFQPDHVLTGTLEVFTHGYSPEAGLAFASELQLRLQALPQVQSAAFGGQLPLSPVSRSRQVQIDDESSRTVEIQLNLVSPAYFETLKMGIEAGRGVTSEDSAQSEPVALVDWRFADRHWRGENPLGRYLRLQDEEQPRRVVGIAATVYQKPLQEAQPPVVYVPFAQHYIGEMHFFVRTTGDPLEALPAMRREVSRLDRYVPVYRAKTLRSHVEESFAQWRLAAALASTAAIWILLLAATGVYGLISYSVQTRRQEFGIRLALGALPSQIAQLQLREGLLLSALGVVLGLLAGLPAASLLSGLLYQVKVFSPALLAMVSAFLLLVALVAGYIPARRAARLDPAQTLYSR